MTYQRDDNTFCGRIFAAVKAVGAGAAAQACGVSENRLRQLSNPCRNDAAVLDTLVRLDAACQKVGGGAPIADLWQARLNAETGKGVQPGRHLSAAVRAAITALRTVVESLEWALSPVPALAPSFQPMARRA